MYIEKETNKIADTLLTVGFGIVVLLLVFIALVNTTSIPDVHISHSTGECVKVINYDERFIYNCSNYPSKYNHIWVK